MPLSSLPSDDLAHAEVATSRRRRRRRPSMPSVTLQVVEERRVGRPELRRSAIVSAIAAARPRPCRVRDLAVVRRARSRTLPRVGARRTAAVDGDVDTLASTSGTIVSESIVRLRHRLEPDRLPDAGGRRVPDAARACGPACRAAACRRRSGPRRRRPAPAARPASERLGDVERERRRSRRGASPTSLPLTQTVASQSTAPKCSSVRRLPRQPARNVERAAIPEPVCLADLLHHAGQGRLDRERHEDLAVERRRAAARRVAGSRSPTGR